MEKEKKILRISFVFGLLFALVEFIFAIYSHSNSALTDAVYDASELVFIALLIFLTPLFHQPISEKHPYGYFQIETIFVVIKSVMMLSVTLGISGEVIKSILSGGNTVSHLNVAIFQLVLGCVSFIIYVWMKRLNKDMSSPTIETELLGWRLDVFYSLGMSFAFFIALYLDSTSLHFLSPYFDQIVAILVMIFTLPDSIKILWNAIREIFLFSPDEELVEELKDICEPILAKYPFIPVHFDVTKTGRHVWVEIYYRVDGDVVVVEQLERVSQILNEKIQEKYEESTCELIMKT